MMDDTHPFPPKSRTTLSIEEKIRLLDLSKDKSNKTSDLLKQFSIALSTFNKIKAQEKVLRETALVNRNLKQKRRRLSSYEDVNQALSRWFHQVRAQNGIVSGPIVMEKAKQLAKAMNVNFEPSNGWLQRWKNSQNVQFQAVQGKKAAADALRAQRWLHEELPGIVNGYEACNIYNADETGLLYKERPKFKTCVIQDDCQTAALRQPKEHLTVLFLCSQDGSDKRMFTVGKTSKPRCFSTIRQPPLPYYSNSMAVMLSALWSQILSEFDRQLSLQNRKVLLFCSDAPYHKLEAELANVKIVLWPPKTTSVLQPLDQGIFKNTKLFYRQQLIRKQLIAVENGKSLMEFDKSVNVLDALHMLKYAWSMVTPEMIKNCFIKAGFPCDGSRFNDVLAKEEAVSSVLSRSPSSESSDNFEEWVTGDDNIECCGELSDINIAALVKQANSAITDQPEVDDEPESPCKPTPQDAIAALRTLRAYYDSEIGENHNDFYKVENQVMKHILHNVAQRKISDNFL